MMARSASSVRARIGRGTSSMCASSLVGDGPGRHRPQVVDAAIHHEEPTTAGGPALCLEATALLRHPLHDVVAQQHFLDLRLCDGPLSVLDQDVVSVLGVPADAYATH